MPGHTIDSHCHIISTAALTRNEDKHEQIQSLQELNGLIIVVGSARCQWRLFVRVGGSVLLSKILTDGELVTLLHEQFPKSFRPILLVLVQKALAMLVDEFARIFVAVPE